MNQRQGLVLAGTEAEFFPLSHKPTSPGWAHTLDASGNVVRVPTNSVTRERTPPVRGMQRRLLGVAWVASCALVVSAFIHFGPMVPKALEAASAYLARTQP